MHCDNRDHHAAGERAALLALLLFASLAVGCTQPEARASTAPLAYVERVIAAEPQARLPLVIAVHGLGDSPEGFLSVFDGLDVPMRIIAPRAPDPHAVGTSWYPIDEPTRAPAAIHARAKLLAELIAYVRARRPTRGLAIVTGFSQGGVLSFALAADHPQLLSAAIPIAGMLPEGGPAPRKAPAQLRVVALHGEEDQRITYARGVQAVERLVRAGTRATMLPYPGVGHTLSEAMVKRYHALLREEVARAAASASSAR